MASKQVAHGIEESQLFRLLDGFRGLSDTAFRELREEIDDALADRHGVAPDALRPWYWEDFYGQRAPSVGRVELDAFFRERDPIAIAAGFFRGIGLPADDVLERSDLFEREGKDQHAFCTDLDRRGDVRVLCNMRNDERWTHTLLHELGHAVYDKFLPADLPYLLRTPSHTLSTEAVAMLMGRLTRDPAWLRSVMGVETTAAQAEDIRRQLRATLLINTRFMLVMAYFERELYRNPNRDDLNRLWWDLIEEIQFIRRPEDRDEPDWAAKIHFTIAPVYFHNYLLGELMASQLDAYIRREVPNGDGSPIGSEPDVGEYLKRKVFAPGASLDWNELLVRSTGEALQPRYFVEQFVER